VHGELLHARLIAQDGALGLLGAGVDGEDGELAASALEDMDAELVDAGALAGAGDTADADADAVAAMRQAALDDLLRDGLVLGVGALDEGHGLPEDGDIALEDALDIVIDGEAASGEAAALQVGVDGRGLLDAAVDDQSLVFFAILWMLHSKIEKLKN